MPEQNRNKPNYIEKKSNMKTESTQQAREIWQVLDSEYATILLRPIKEWRVITEMIPKMISTCRFKDFFLGKQNKCIDIFTENVYFRI